MKTTIKYQLTQEQFDNIFSNKFDYKYYANVLGITSANFNARKNSLIFTNDDLRKVCKIRNIEYPFLKPCKVIDYFEEEDIIALKERMKDQHITITKLSELCGVSRNSLTKAFGLNYGISSKIVDKLYNCLYPND